jgi:hypothetical protein
MTPNFVCKNYSHAAFYRGHRVLDFLRTNSFLKLLLLFSLGAVLIGISKGVGIPFVPFIRLSGGGGCGGAGCSGDPGGGSCGAGSGCVMSTPFLKTWDGKKFVFDNDFLLGTPTSFYLDRSSGQKAYESGNVGPDLYRLQNTFKSSEDEISFQIKEIEAEESYIDHLSFKRVVYPENSELVVDSKHRNYYIFTHAALEKKQGVKQQQISIKEKDVTASLEGLDNIFDSRSRETEYRLEIGDTVEVRGVVKNKKAPLFLLLGSRYRDWTAGQVNLLQEDQQFAYRINTKSARFFQVAPAFLIIAFLWVGSALGAIMTKLSRDSNEGDISHSVFNIPIAHADVAGGGSSGGHSLLVESYWDWEKEGYQLSEVIHPRHNQYSVDAIELPKQAISSTGEVRIRVTATKRHYVSLISLFAPDTVLEPRREENLLIKKVMHKRLNKDYTDVISKKLSGEYLHTIPGDEVNITVSSSAQTKLNSGERESYLLGAAGFYTPMSEEARNLAGNWLAGLDEDARKLLKEMYPVNSRIDFEQERIVPTEYTSEYLRSS